MAQNFLYMFEFVVDDLLIMRPNPCAPEEYPTCCELTFRSHVFVSICDKEFGGCIDTASKNGKCCLFSLDAPIKKLDKLQLSIFKKKTDQCKFLIGATEIPVFKIFDKVTESFYKKNPNWDAHLKKEEKPSSTSKSKDKAVIDNDCGGADRGPIRKEELCPTYELNKKLLALANLSGIQTGNIVLIMRLACMGPTIVSPFPFGNGAESEPPVCPKLKVPCQKEEVNDTLICRRYFSYNSEKSCPCAQCQDEVDRSGRCPKAPKRENMCSTPSTGKGCPCPDCDDACKEAKAKALRRLKELVKQYGPPQKPQR